MSTPKSYSSLKYIISQRSKEKQSSLSLPKDYSTQNQDRLFVPKKNLSTCELITNVSNDLDDEEIYLDQDEINGFKNELDENNEADQSDGSSIDSSLLSVPATISLLERLIRAHPIWLLTNLERSEVNRLLQNKEPGSFIVRNSSKPGTMALSVRLPKGKGPYIEHYLIENLGDRRMHLEGSERYFSVIPMLICHYCQHVDELPVCLKLPDIILNASRHQLNSLSLLSEKFWTIKNFDEQIYSLSENEDEPKKDYFNERNDDKTNQNSIFEQNNNLIQNAKKSLDGSSDKLRNSFEDDRQSIEARELMFDSEEDEDDADHNFIKKEVFSSESCDNQENEETEVKRHFLMEDDKLDDQLDDLISLKLNEKDDQNDCEELKNKKIESNNEFEKAIDPPLPVIPPRKKIVQPINISPPLLPSRDLKPIIKAQYFKLSTVDTTTTTTKSIEENNHRKKSVGSNLNLLIDFDVLEEEEKLIEQLKENEIFNLNAINAQTQQLMSSQMLNKLNSDSSIDEQMMNSSKDESRLDDQLNITKIEVNIGTSSSTDPISIQEKLNELNLIEMKLNESKEGLELQQAANNKKIEEPLIVESTIVEPIELKPLIEQSSLIQPLIAQKLNDDSVAKTNKIETKSNTYEGIWLKPAVRPKETKKCRVETRNCEVQTDAQTILNDLKLERYKNFLVYDYAPNLKLNNQLSKELNIFADPIYSTTNEDLLFYQHFFKRNLSNPNLNQLSHQNNYDHNQVNKNTESHSFESLYVTYDSVFAKQNQFFERYIVPRDSNVSDVCLQVGDGLIKDQSRSRKNSIRTELINEERVKLVDEKKQKDVEWQVDHSWEFCSDDEELTSSIANNEISSKYRRYSCKYIIESGLESDSDGELNEDDLQSMLNDNVKLDGLNLNANNQVNVENVEVKRSNQVTMNNEKTNSPPMLIDTEEPCSSGYNSFFQQQPNSGFVETNNSNINKMNDHLQKTERQPVKLSRQSSARHAFKQKQKNEETEDDDEMLFQEIDLDDVYTTNDELDDNQSLTQPEDIYTVTARNVTYSTVARSISEYIFELYRLNDNVFAKSINNFIQCTRDLYETDPLVIMRNIRQFMNGMKNYLIKNGEKEFLDFVKHERKRLKAEEFLNLEAIVTTCLHKLVIKPLKEFIYAKFISMDYRFGYESYMKLCENINFLNTRLPEEFEIKNNVRLPNNKSMKRIAKFISKLQSSYSPLKKLEYILSVVSIINFNSKIIDKQTIDGKIVLNKQRIDERTFVSIFLYIVAKYNVVNIEFEIEFIWSLLQQNLINGDAFYWLSLLSSCIYVLKCNFLVCQERNYPLNTIELQRSMITAYLPSLNETVIAKCKLSLFQKENSTNLVLPKIIDHPDLNLKNLKNSKKRNHTFNQNINELTLVNSNFVQSYPSALNNYRQDPSSYRTHILHNNLPLKLSSLFTICCLKILILDDFTGNINCKQIVIRPEMRAKEFGRLIAQKFVIFNTEDYSLFLLTQEGKEFQIDENDLPFSIKINAIKYGINLSFVFKRTDSNYVFSNKFYELNHFESFGLI